MQAEPPLSRAVSVAGGQSVQGVLDRILRLGDLCDACFMRADWRELVAYSSISAVCHSFPKKVSTFR